MDAGNTVNGAWNACRDELVRLARENAELCEALHDDSARIVREGDDERAVWKQRAERAEAELAALKKERDALKSALAKWDQWIKDGMHVALLPLSSVELTSNREKLSK